MSQSEIYTVWCLVVGEDVSFPVKIEKSAAVGELKKLIEENSNTFAGIDANFLDLYHVNIPDADKEELMASAKACRLDSPSRTQEKLIEIFPSGPERRRVHFLVKPSRKRPASRELEHQAKRREMITELPSVEPLSATEQNVHDRFEDKICHNRPNAKHETIPIALLHEAFGFFLKNCQEHTPTQTENQWLAALRTERLRTNPNETMRKVSFMGTLKRYSKVLSTAGWPFVTDGQYRAEDHLMLITEGNDEWDGLKADPLLKAFMRYIHYLKSRQNGKQSARLPCFIIYYIGPFIGFAGAIVADKPMLEPLTPLFSLHTNAHDGNASKPLARTLGAFENALKSLQEYYTHIKITEPTDIPACADPEFPYRTYYTTPEGRIDFQYDFRMYPEKLLFFCTRTSDRADLCIKFTQKYSKEAHQHCATNGVAPKLHAVEELPGGWLMVVMEYLEISLHAMLNVSSNPANPLLEAGVKAAVDVLHQGGFVHGDIRDINMTVKREWDKSKGAENIKLVDFDWAGPEGTTLYPANVNYWSVKRPVDARDGMPITKNHDLEMVAQMFK